MATVTLAEFRTRFPEFSTTGDAQVNRRLAEAQEIHNLRATATYYCCAHLLALDEVRTAQQADTDLDKVDDGAGEVQSEGAGPSQTLYRTMAEEGREVFFTRTDYGREFLTQEKRTPAYVFAFQSI